MPPKSTPEPLCHQRSRTSILGAAVALAISVSPTFAQTSTADLLHNFQSPPVSARPMVRWWWFGPAVVTTEILRELQQMKADGFGGAELAFVYPEVLDDPGKDLKNLAFLSPGMLEAVTYAQAEGRRLGLRIDVTLCSGWPYGGPATTLAEAAGHLRIAEVPVAPNASSVTAPTLAAGESLISAAVANSKRLPPESQLPARGHNALPRPVGWDASSAHPLTLSGASATLASATQPRVALFFIASHTGQQVKRAAVGAEGWVLDPFSHQAVATHLKSVGDPLIKAFGATPPYAIFSDSLEAYGADWTPNLPAEFRKRRGYDLLPHLPEIAAGGSSSADNVRHDWGKTLTELVNENYLTQINQWAIAHHTKFRSQTYGEPAVSFSSQNLVGLAEGEGPQWRAFSTLRWATSANHVFGHNVTSGETFTWLHSPVFRATPLDMKAETDIDLIMGENQIICHGWPYSPPSSQLQPGDPGWSLYAAAVFNDHNPWHPVMPSVTSYIGRLSYLMRQGQPANQVAILLPTDDAWAGFAPSHVTVTGAMQRVITPGLMSAILGAGYNVDFIDADAINSAGLHHQLLVLPPTDRIPLQTLRKIQTFVASGGKAISIGRAPSIDADGKTSAALTSLSKKLFDPANSTLVPDDSHLAEALHTAVKPDLQLANTGSLTDKLGFIRRKLPSADIYFLANTGNTPLDTTVGLTSSFKSGTELNPDTGLPSDPASPGQVRLHLAPYQSRVFLFSNSAPGTPAPLQAPANQIATQVADLSSGWKLTFTSKSRTASLPSDWTSDPATLHYSGEAVYARDVSLPSAPAGPIYLEVSGGTALPGSPDSPPEHASLGTNGLPNPLVTRTGPGMHAYFDPPIREAALVTVNGTDAGALWHPPYLLNISKLLKPGSNRIEIHVFNTALNAWSANPPRDYKPLIAKFGDRFQMQDLDKVKPLPSGILGSIRLVSGAPE